MKEILRESLHSSLKVKSKDIQDKFLETANSLIRKGANISTAIQAGNKAAEQYELELQELADKQKEEQVQITATRYVKTGTKYRFYIWADATVNLVTTDLPGTTPGTVTLPAIRLSLA